MTGRNARISRSKVIMMCGPAGSGKSTYAKKMEQYGMTVLSYDEESFKRGITQHPLPEETAKGIKQILDKKLISLIMENGDVVLDYSFWSKEMRKEYILLLRKYGIEPVIYYIKVQKETAMERILRRNGESENEIRLSLETASFYYDHFQPPTEDEGNIIEINGY